MSSIDELRLFDRYVSSEMSKDERQAFEQRLAKDDEFKNSFDEFRVTIESVKAMAHRDMKSKMNSWKAEMDKEEAQNEKRNNKGWLYALLALGLLLAGASWFYFFNQDDNTNTNPIEVESHNSTDLFAAYYEPPAPDITRGGGDEKYDQIYLLGVEQRAEKELDKAITTLSSIPKTHKRYLEVQELIIDMYMEKGDFQKAERVLIQNMATENELFLQKGDWYRAMLELKQNDIPGAQKQLKKILYSKNHFYYTKASKLSEALKKLK